MVQKSSHNEIQTQIHSGRRKKLRQRFIKDGLGTFNECEVIEFALGFGMPRIDTNPIAHRLLNKFGSLASVVDANPKDLMEVAGLGENSAVFISFVKQFAIYLASNKLQSVQINSIADAIKYLYPIMSGYTTEVFVLLCLNKSNKILFLDTVTNKELDKVDINIREVVSQILRTKTAAVIIAHNHLTDDSSPSVADIKLTQKIMSICCSLNVDFIDHIIFAASGMFSFSEKGIIDEFKQHTPD
jgi:DNA repair protein RadC